MGLDSITQVVGQRLLVGFDGEVLSDDVKYLIDTLKVGGVVLFKRNLSNPTQIKELCTSLQAHAKDSGQPPLIIAIDQEGGQVARLCSPFTEFQGNPAMTREEEATDFAKITAEELTSVGVNMNLAPVVDVLPRGGDSIMSGRSFGDNVDWVSTMGRHVIQGLQERGIMAVAKHFPGIGRTILDSHVDKPVVDSEENELLNVDIKPFQTAIECGVAGIMLSHIEYTAIDSEWPASLSEKIVQGWLRHRLQYEGVVMTDDLDMGAICKHFGIETIMSRVLVAGVDLMLICHRSDNMEKAVAVMTDQYRKSSQKAQLVEQSTQRIRALKEKFLSGFSPTLFL